MEWRPELANRMGLIPPSSPKPSLAKSYESRLSLAASSPRPSLDESPCEDRRVLLRFPAMWLRRLEKRDAMPFPALSILLMLEPVLRLISPHRLAGDMRLGDDERRLGEDMAVADAADDNAAAAADASDCCMMW